MSARPDNDKDYIMNTISRKGKTLIIIRGGDGTDKWVSLQYAIQQQDSSVWFPKQKFCIGIGGNPSGKMSK